MTHSHRVCDTVVVGAVHKPPTQNQTQTMELTLNSTVSPAEKPRLQTQCQRILGAFIRESIVSSTQLASITGRYSTRISDLRKSGHNIEMIEQNRETGVSWYKLLPKEQAFATITPEESITIQDCAVNPTPVTESYA